MEEAKKIITVDFDKAAALSIEERRSLIAAIEDHLKGFPQAEIPVKHSFSKGVYGREVTMAAGLFVVGKIHKHHTMNVILKGEVSVMSQDGIYRYVAPCTFVSTPGAKRFLYTHSETVWATFHGSNETDLVKLEEEFIAKDYDEIVPLDGAKETVCLGLQLE